MSSIDQRRRELLHQISSAALLDAFIMALFGGLLATKQPWPLVLGVGFCGCLMAVWIGRCIEKIDALSGSEGRQP